MEKVSGILQIILSLVEDRFVGQTVLSKILKGSKSKEILERNLHTSKEFGALYWLNENVIKYILDELFKKDYLKYVDVGGELGLNFQIYKVKLTEKGKLALINKEEVVFEINDDQLKDYSRISTSAEESLKLFNELKTVDAVAEKRKLVKNTIYDHLEECIKKGLLQVNLVVPEERIKTISEVIKTMKYPKLKEIETLLPPEISYGEIRCVNARMR